MLSVSYAWIASLMLRFDRLTYTYIFVGQTHFQFWMCNVKMHHHRVTWNRSQSHRQSYYAARKSNTSSFVLRTSKVKRVGNCISCIGNQMHLELYCPLLKSNTSSIALRSSYIVSQAHRQSNHAHRKLRHCQSYYVHRQSSISPILLCVLEVKNIVNGNTCVINQRHRQLYYAHWK